MSKEVNRPLELLSSVAADAQLAKRAKGGSLAQARAVGLDALGLRATLTQSFAERPDLAALGMAAKHGAAALGTIAAEQALQPRRDDPTLAARLWGDGLRAYAHAHADSEEAAGGIFRISFDE